MDSHLGGSGTVRGTSLSRSVTAGTDRYRRFREVARGTHLFVCQHGLWGSTEDTAFLEAYLSHQGTWLTHNASTNSARLTYDGIDTCGDRLASEVIDRVQRLIAEGNAPPVTHVSFAGYSLGGLIVRYAIGKLAALGFFRYVTPVNFITFSSPHLGCWATPNNMSQLAYNSIIPWTLSRTGRQLVLADQWLGGRPLLSVMADPAYAFHAGLARFQKRVLLADIGFDRTVPYVTAAIELLNPYADGGTVPRPISRAYPCIVVPYTQPSPGPTHQRLAHVSSSADRQQQQAADSDGSSSSSLRRANSAPNILSRMASGSGLRCLGLALGRGQSRLARGSDSSSAYSAGNAEVAPDDGGGSSLWGRAFGSSWSLPSLLQPLLGAARGDGGSAGAVAPRPTALPSRARWGIFLVLLPVLLSLWLCTVAWVAAISIHHYAVLLTVRPDRGWDVTAAAVAAACGDGDGEEALAADGARPSSSSSSSSSAAGDDAGSVVAEGAGGCGDVSARSCDGREEASVSWQAAAGDGLRTLRGPGPQPQASTNDAPQSAGAAAPERIPKPQSQALQGAALLPEDKRANSRAGEVAAGSSSRRGPAAGARLQVAPQDPCACARGAALPRRTASAPCLALPSPGMADTAPVAVCPLGMHSPLRRVAMHCSAAPAAPTPGVRRSLQLLASGEGRQLPTTPGVDDAAGVCRMPSTASPASKPSLGLRESGAIISDGEGRGLLPGAAQGAGPVGAGVQAAAVGELSHVEPQADGGPLPAGANAPGAAQGQADSPRARARASSAFFSSACTSEEGPVAGPGGPSSLSGSASPADAGFDVCAATVAAASPAAQAGEQPAAGAAAAGSALPAAGGATQWVRASPEALICAMCEQLNVLDWLKVDVDTRHHHAHAAIVVRSSRRFASHMHIIDYAVRQLRS